MNIYTVIVLTSLVCGIYAVSPRGDKGVSANRAPFPPLKPLGPPNRPEFCYDHQVRRDQYFDDSFICTDTLKYPEGEINYALRLPENRKYANFMKIASRCFTEENYVTDHKVVNDSHSFNCVCKSDRRIITSVNYSTQRCHIVSPLKQRIYYAKCSGRCNLAYGYLEGYFCVNRGYVNRNFLVYCEANNEAFMQYTHGKQFHGHGIGGFYFMKETLPTYCGCRGYFCK
ncbi:hypothetical protein SNE40_018838 [Patella caerulea]|uniref:Uncharacterized protein n=1 Tax=Patella caerulea TaxID=87958 RepID=A0AAN8J5M0_PATCE